MDDHPKILELEQLPIKSNDLLPILRTYSICTSFNEIIKVLKEVPPNFTIITKNNKYKCHLEIIAAVSKVILQALQNDPKLNEYSISKEFDDSKFNQFASFLNGDIIKISDDNHSYFKRISELLQIDIKYFDPDSHDELLLNRFSRQFHMILPEIPKTISISNNVGTYSVDYLIALSYSPVIKDAILSNPDKLNIIITTQGDISEIAKYLNDNTMDITVENFTTIKECFSELEITADDSVLSEIANQYQFINPIAANINLYDTILDINNSNIDEIHQLLINSRFYLDSNLHIELCHALEDAFKYRPKYFESVINLVSKLQSESFHNSLFIYLKTQLLACQLSIPFLRSLYDEKIITHDEIIKFLNLDISINYDIDYIYTSNCRRIKNELTLFFAKTEYEQNPESFLKNLNSTLNNTFLRGNHKASQLQRYIDHWDEYEKEVNMHYVPDNFYGAILKDDSDALQAITSQHPDFDYDKKITPYLFEKNTHLLGNDLTLASLAAFYGSLRCFRFLVLQQADISKCAKYAIMGGNPEIIRLVQQNDGNFKNVYYCAIEFHRYELLKWLIMNEGPISDLYQKNFRINSEPSLETAILSHNDRALLYFFDNGIDNQKKNSDTTFIGISVLSFNITALKLMLKTFRADPNKINLRSNYPPIFHAAYYNSLKMVKLLVEYGKCQIPKKGEYDVLAFSAKKGFTDIVDYLAPYYSDIIDSKYIDIAANEQIKEILNKYIK